MTLACPKCGGNQLQNVRMIYEGGVNKSSISGYTFNTDGSNNSLGSFRGSNTSTSALAQRFAPPDTDRAGRIRSAMTSAWIGGAVSLFIGLVCFLFSTIMGVSLFILGAALIGYGYYKQSQLDDATRQDLYEGEKLLKWANSVVCHTCGNQFVAAR